MLLALFVPCFSGTPHHAPTDYTLSTKAITHQYKLARMISQEKRIRNNSIALPITFFYQNNDRSAK